MKTTKRLVTRTLSALLALIFCLSALSLCLSAAEPASLVNLYDKRANTMGWYGADGSAIGTAQMGNTTDPVAVRGGALLTFGPVGKEQACALHVYDGAGNVIAGELGIEDLTEVDDDFVDYRIVSYRLPENAASVRFLVPATVLHTFLATQDQPFDAEDYDVYWNSDSSRAKFVRNYGQHFPVKNDGVLYGKSALFLGDSLCMAKPAGFYYYGWAGRIGEINDMDYLNAGQSGTAFSNRSHYGRIIEQFYMSDKTDYDYVILEGGINDAWFEADVGVMTEGFDGPFDVSTFAGGFEETIKVMKERYPNAQYGHIIHYETPDAPYGRIPEAALYVEMAKKICDKWEIPYLDLFNDRAFCYEVLKVDTRDFMYDDVHVDVHGYDLLYPKIEAWMAKLGQPEVIEPAPEDDTTTPEGTTAAPADTTTAAPTEETTGGCGATLEMPMLAMMTAFVLLGGVLVKKKQER